MLRCIHCGRGKVTLTDSFECIETMECKEWVTAKNAPIKKVSIFFDAACMGGNVAQGQPLGIGVHTVIDGVVVPDYCGIKAIGVGTNNDGEWIAFLYALKVAIIIRKELKSRCHITMFSDSKLVVNCFSGEYKVSTKFKANYNKSQRLCIQLGIVFNKLIWIPREKNQEADKLSKDALKLYK